ncbi:MAG TPA: sigma 54-interacting transcriptional regulator, partial [Pyrinomonadaceae bacterium]|nr:sigma 54-interacting transcriptional regulator [Pyrinomonadaceae bacterium]
GERPEQIPQETAPREMAVDWREMQRWKISEASLPAGTIVHFRQPTFWEQYKWYVVATIFAFVIESLLIVWLVINDRRRRRAEREQERFALLAESEHVRLDEVVSNVPGIVWETRLEPGTNLIKTTFISDFLKRMLGYTPEEWLSLPPNVGFNIIPEEDREGAIRDCEAVMASGKEGISQYRLTTKDGRIVWVESHQSPIFDEHKTVVGLRGVTLDVSERKLAEDAQRESESRFRNMADSAPVMIWISGSDRQCIYVNQQWLDFTGRTMEQEVGEGWTAGVHPDDYARGREIYGAAFDAKETFNFEYRLRRADGVFRWVFVTGTPRLSETGELLGYVGSCIDITERKESEVALRTALEEVSHLKNQLQEENIYLQEEIKLEQNFGEIVGQSDALKYVLFKIEQVAPTETTVLITGETGTGKELVARAIHSASARRDRPLVKVNCAALAPSLIESEFFGHEKGAFTGAGARKIGRFELANGATIFLDEIGELPTELQVKLLRVIQEGELERLGGTKTIKVDVRIIAATNRHLEEDVKQGLFREDLWYRLNVFPITVPPLRQRREDIPLLVEHFARSFSTRLGKLISSVAPVTMNSLRDHPWPGNVRELANVIERAVINSQGSVLRVSEDFVKNAAETPSALNKTLEEIERDHISRILEDRGWRIEGQNGAARILGMNPSTLRTRMAKLGVHKPSHSLSKSTN